MCLLISDIDTNSDGINAKLDHCLNLFVCSTDNNNKHCMPEWSKESVVMYFVATKELYSLHKLVNILLLLLFVNGVNLASKNCIEISFTL